MKKPFALALAGTMLVAPFAQAQQWREPPHHDRRYDDRRDYRDYRDYEEKRRWARGQRMADWRRHQAVREYRRYGLREPGRGQQWVRVDNQFVLLSVATGVILGLTAVR
ncbi:RcnB family protein [Rhizobium grahamii]|uniref:RcnB family protein n=1 Tax=Rhizobium grahamii TaxID=1120045 RepID=A0A370KKE3_9HYPH|nr:RcnB family protein [Rhizobium grahamii]RDJ07897.1 hypothetical protein B5K06_21410 [Rhizobium grahamii]